MNKLQTRREFIRNSAYLAAGIALYGCGGGSSSSSDGDSDAPLWSRIPTQSLIVGVPVYFDFADYVTDPNGDAVTIYLNKTLPPGLTLNGTVISGTPTAEVAAETYVVTADDGTG